MGVLTTGVCLEVAHAVSADTQQAFVLEQQTCPTHISR